MISTVTLFYICTVAFAGMILLTLVLYCRYLMLCYRLRQVEQADHQAAAEAPEQPVDEAIKKTLSGSHQAVTPPAQPAPENCEETGQWLTENQEVLNKLHDQLRANRKNKRQPGTLTPGKNKRKTRRKRKSTTRIPLEEVREELRARKAGAESGTDAAPAVAKASADAAPADKEGTQGGGPKLLLKHSSMAEKIKHERAQSGQQQRTEATN